MATVMEYTLMTLRSQLVCQCLLMVNLTFIVACRLLLVRLAEMKDNKLSLQDVATSRQVSSVLTRVQASDNFRNLFEVPVLFYVLCTICLTLASLPKWLIVGGWFFVALRYFHSWIQCTYNRVIDRFICFFSSFLILQALWVGVFLTFQPSM